MKEVIIVTHTEATHHIDGIVGGWLDSELTDKGCSDARLCGLKLKELNLEGTPVVASDLKRAANTGRIIAKVLDSTVSYDARLREMSFGEGNGQSRQWFDKALMPYGDDMSSGARLDHAIIKGCEPRRVLAQRLYEVMDELDTRHQRLIIATHGFAATFLIAHWIKMPLESVGYVNFNLQPGSITRLQQDAVNRNVMCLDDTRHLA
jgi:probable phosphoglycerate mutase